MEFRIVLLSLCAFFTPVPTAIAQPVNAAPRCHVGDPSIDWYLSLDESQQAKFVDQYRQGFSFTYEIARINLKELFPGPDIVADGRLKSISSIREKIERKRAEKKTYRCFRDIGDIIGLRIIVPDYSGLPDIDKAIKSNFVIDKIDNQISSDQQSEYRAVHYDITLDGRRGELQVHTRRSTLLADVSHKLVYKGPFKDNSQVKAYVAALSYAIHELDSSQNKALPDLPDRLPPEAEACFVKLLARLSSLSVTGPFDSAPVCNN